MSAFVEIFNKLIVQSFKQIYDFAVQYGPGIIISIALILTGWILAVLVKKIIAKLLRALGFDVLSERIGFKRFLEKGGISKRPSVLVGSVFYWIILLNALIMAQDAVDLEITSRFIQSVILYIPNIIVVIILFALSIFISGFISRFVEKSANLAHIPYCTLLGNMARYTVIGLAIMMIIEYLNVPSFVEREILILIFVAIPLAFFIIFIAAGRDILANLLHGRNLSRLFKPGDTIEIDSVSGKIVSVGAVTTKLKNNDEEIVIPNAELARGIIRRKLS
ncbi:MAG: mechanosensitive ion channel [Candidatus Omnitrophica bacterium]|nr:mechanosensitive ion channel [Candidatus Omnitrophota bacterium]